MRPFQLFRADPARNSTDPRFEHDFPVRVSVQQTTVLDLRFRRIEALTGSWVVWICVSACPEHGFGLWQRFFFPGQPDEADALPEPVVPATCQVEKFAVDRPAAGEIGRCRGACFFSVVLFAGFGGEELF